MSHTPPPSSLSGRGNHDADCQSPDSPVVFELLDDELSLTIVTAIRETPKPARELVDECDASRPTVYRRLDRLETAGFVQTRIELDPDGHHRKVFTTDAAAISLDLDDGEFTASVRRDGL
jgi:predicted transcriptional regulator